MTEEDDAWGDPVHAHKMQYRGMEFDSKLELMWWLTLEDYGFDCWDHPGTLELSGGVNYEPDFLVGEVLCEVKGEHDNRIEKPHEAWRIYQKPVLILRPGVVPEDDEVEEAGCDWESADGRTWVAVLEPGKVRWCVEEDVPQELSRAYVRYAAREVLLDSTKVGMTLTHWSKFKVNDE